MQAYKTTAGANFDQRETCPTDQHTTDKVPIIVGGVLAGLILLTLVLYLIYRAMLPPETLHLIAESSSMKEDDSVEESEDRLNSDDEEQRHGAHRNHIATISIEE
ncbi:hypothetical protein WR25_12682 [Diploscapter pachys]|uniref:Uncharacterized protein n=1 Tax=Diploscapter pachys TaxID=2018661 RepID=A0A2A2K2T5_9BILA|nr:hypothetical protein WR25_12682 [Diploscapter pachys]